MDSLSVSPALVLLFVLVAGLYALGGLALLIFGAWLWYTTRLVASMARKGELYLSNLDNQQARQIKLAYDMATGLTYVRQVLKQLDPEMAKEFYAAPEEKKAKKGKKP